MADDESGKALEVDSSNRKDTEQKQLQENQPGDEDEEGEEKRDGGQLHSGESQLVQSESCEQLQLGARSAEAKSETLAVPSSLQGVVNDQRLGLPESHTATESTGEAQLKEETGACDENTKGIAVAVVDQAPIQSQVQVSVLPTSGSELSSTVITQTISSAPRSTIPDNRLSTPEVDSFCTPQTNQKSHSNGRSVTPNSVIKRSSADGYNWRKYGQKQVKSPGGSRSYYRCTHCECIAKKIECCNHLGHVIEVVYRSHHSHDPPKKVGFSRESKLAPSIRPLTENKVTEAIRMLDDVAPSPASKELVSSKELVRLKSSTPEREQKISSSPIDNGEAKVKQEHFNKVEPKRRAKKEDLTCSDAETKPGKKMKFVVHAVGEMGISGDGYRWRKYGQKMVKGNPKPRNYYRCTSAGCPVRKHIESALDNTSAVVITYRGVHDHDMPVPKKRHGPPSGPLVAAATPTTSMNNLQHEKMGTEENQISSSQRPAEKEGDLTGNAKDLGGEKAMESARTLLSIGFEIRPC